MNTDPEIVEEARINEGHARVVSFEGMPTFGGRVRYESEDCKSLVNRLKAEGYFREDPEVEEWIRSINEMEDSDLPSIQMCSLED